MNVKPGGIGGRGFILKRTPPNPVSNSFSAADSNLNQMNINFPNSNTTSNNISYSGNVMQRLALLETRYVQQQQQIMELEKSLQFYMGDHEKDTMFGSPSQFHAKTNLNDTGSHTPAQQKRKSPTAFLMEGFAGMSPGFAQDISNKFGHLEGFMEELQEEFKKSTNMQEQRVENVIKMVELLQKSQQDEKEGIELTIEEMKEDFESRLSKVQQVFFGQKFNQKPVQIPNNKDKKPNNNKEKKPIKKEIPQELAFEGSPPSHNSPAIADLSYEVESLRREFHSKLDNRVLPEIRELFSVATHLKSFVETKIQFVTAQMLNLVQQLHDNVPKVRFFFLFLKKFLKTSIF